MDLGADKGNKEGIELMETIMCEGLDSFDERFYKYPTNFILDILKKKKKKEIQKRRTALRFNYNDVQKQGRRVNFASKRN